MVSGLTARMPARFSRRNNIKTKTMRNLYLLFFTFSVLLITSCKTQQVYHHVAVNPDLISPPAIPARPVTRYELPTNRTSEPPENLAWHGDAAVYADAGFTRDGSVAIREVYRFPDVNTTQLEAARKVGIEPFENREQAQPYLSKLTHVFSNRFLLLDPMTHSQPYLTRRATDIIMEIGYRFQTRLVQQGYQPHRIICTSMFRTKDDQRRLSRVNSNAAAVSTHCHATTFDLSYHRFNRISNEGQVPSSQTMADILGEVLDAMRNEGKIYIKFESRQRCYHITSRR